MKLYLAAAAGIVAGCRTRVAHPPEQPIDTVVVKIEATPPSSANETQDEPLPRIASPTPAPSAEWSEWHCCKGMNECKGRGNCKVERRHDCAGKNACKGLGGCKPMDCPGQ